MRRTRKEKELSAKTGFPVVNLSSPGHKCHHFRLRRAGRGWVWEKVNA